MKFSRSGSFYQVSRVTGPTRNVLRLEIATEAASYTPVIEGIELNLHEARIALDEETILNEVIKGVSAANLANSSSYSVKRVQYVISDSPTIGVYEFMARSIVDRIAKGGEF